MKRLVILVSGNGTNLQCVIDAVESNLIDAKIAAIICNKKNAYAIDRGKRHNILTIYAPYIKDNITRLDYDNNLSKIVFNLHPDLIILAGWMHILSATFISKFNNIINLHPALYGEFPGKNAIENAYNAFQHNQITHTGIMVHRVITEIDAGEVIAEKKIKIFKNDTLIHLKTRVHLYEKGLLLFSIQKILLQMDKENNANISDIVLNRKIGKVRELYTINNKYVLFMHTDRLSSFDRYICDIPGKGNLLNLTSTWWLNRTKHIIDNHLVYSKDNMLVAKKCQVIPLEIIVRGYITGSTETSLWTHYSRGVRNYCGIDFPDNLVKNQKLPLPVVTPTTKGIKDELISGEEIINRGILSRSEWNYIHHKALELYNYGSVISNSKGLILVDTKYEFGRDINGKIILIDEIHTCDSSRYWKLDSYPILLNEGKEPIKLDKDTVRDYIKKICDPYNVETIHSIPDDKIQSVLKCYLDLYKILNRNVDNLELQTYNNIADIAELMNLYIKNTHPNLVVIISGSESDSDFVSKIQKQLDLLDIFHCYYVSSAHKSTKNLLDILGHYGESKRNIVYVTVAGRSNALSGVVAAQTNYPVIACPPFADKLDMMTNIQSSLQCPSKTPVMTILEPSNVALSCQRMFNFSSR